MNIKNINFALSKSNCCFNFGPKETQLTINLEDKVIVDEISDRKLEMIVSRKLFSSDIDKIMVTVEFNVYIDLSSKTTFDELKNEISLGMPLLFNVFTRISAVISGITSYSLLGPVVTAPNYDKSKIIIESTK